MNKPGQSTIELLDVASGATKEMFNYQGLVSANSFWQMPRDNLRSFGTGRPKVPVYSASVIWWTSDSRYVLYSGSKVERADLKTKVFAHVFDAEVGKEVQFDAEVNESVFSKVQTVMSVPVPDGFIVKVQKSSASQDESSTSSSMLYRLQPSNAQITEIRQTGVSLTDWSLAEGLGDYLLFSKTGTKKTETEWMRVRIENDELVDPRTITCVGIDRLVSSPNGERFSLMTFDPRSYSMTQSTNFGTQYSTDTKLLRTYPFTVSVWNWEQVTGGKVEEIKTKPIIAWKPMDDNSEIVWHPQGRYLSIFGQGTASLIIMDTDSGSWKHIPNIVKTTEGHTVRPIQDGWLALTPDTLQIMELNGELRKTFILGSMKEESLDEMGSGSGCWILANGESSKSLPDSLKHQVFFLYRRDNRVLVESYESVSSRQRQPKQIKLTSFRVSRITAKRTSSQEATIMEIPWVDWYNSLVKPSWTPQPRTIVSFGRSSIP